MYFGSRRMSDTRFWVGNQNSRMYFGWNTLTYAQSNISANVIYEAKLNYLNDRKATLDNETALNISTTLSPTNTYPIYVFAGDSGGSVISGSSIKLYDFRISEGSSMTHDFVPAYRITDKVMGLYDVTAGGFYTNSGTGEFKGEITLVDGDTTVTNTSSHTLYALWEEE